MPAAFIGAGIANIGAGVAYHIYEFAVARHV
jgi:hypothetical protein